MGQTVAGMHTGTHLRNMQANAKLSECTEAEAIEKLCGIFDVMRNIDGIRQPYKPTDESDDDPFAKWDKECATYRSDTTSTTLRSMSTIFSQILDNTDLVEVSAALLNPKLEKFISTGLSEKLKTIKG